MVDQQQAYQLAMREAADAAYEQDWARAAKAYERAYQFAPEDSQALNGMAWSYLESQQYRRAQDAYTRVSEKVPGDPLPHEKLAEIHEILDEYDEAAKQRLSAAEIHFGRKDLAKALPHWQKAIQLNPDLPQAHMRLAVIYEKSRRTREQAIYSYVTLARLLQRHNQAGRAEQALQRAMQLDATNAEARNALDNLKQGKPIEVVDPALFAVNIQLPTTDTGSLADDDEDLLFADEEEGRSPLQDAAHYAMSLLSDMVFDGSVPANAMSPLVSGIELHQVGDAAAAIDLYKKAEKAGLKHPALNFNLGLLYQHVGESQEAIDRLTQASEAQDYMLAGNLALGQLYLTEGEVRQAARHLARSLRLADEQLTGEVDTDGYERLQASLSENPLDQLTEMSRGIVAYLNHPRWRQRLQETRAGYAAQGKVAYVSDLAELVTEGGQPQMAQIMERVDIYLKQGLIRIAMEETQYALEKTPEYLPAHQRMADILVREGRSQAAADKINLVANTYLIRGNAERAADLFAEVLEIWPTDMAARERVIEMLKEQGRIREVVHHYGEMADQYYRVRFDQARAIEIYNEATRYAEQNGAAPEQIVRLLKALADIEAQQLNWQQALKYYRRCQELLPEDREIAMEVIKLNLQMGESAQAIKTLDDYMRASVAAGDIEGMVDTLEALVRQHQTEAHLRRRLADVYRQQGRTAEAIAQYDAVGEMLLDAGEIDAAIKVIEGIVSLDPPDVEGYQKLLAQLKGSAG